MILVVDDDPAIRKIVVHTLKRAEFECVEAADGEEALQVARQTPPDLVVLDLMMPRMDGIEVCRRLRQDVRTTRAPVLILSAIGEEDSIRSAMETGADEYVVKPFQGPVLVAKVRALLAGRARPAGRLAPILDVGPGSVLDGRWRVEDLLGHGGMGRVYRVRDVAGEYAAELALKVLDCRDEDAAEGARRFEREVAALSAIAHPNVVRIHRAGLHERVYHYYAMEYCTGSNLHQRIAREGALPPATAFAIAADIAAGLSAVHASGFVHRDVKPQNVFLTDEGRVKIGDFGIVFPIERVKTRLTREGTIIGTGHYMSPEQIRGDLVDPRSDVYSLGTVLFEMLVGHVPNPNDTDITAIVKILQDAPPLPREIRPDLPEAADEICGRAHRLDRNERYSEIAWMAEDLRRAAQGRLGSDPRRPL